MDGQVGGDEGYDQGNEQVYDGGVGGETDYNVWRDSLVEELVCAQGYGPGQLSREHREMLDIEYQRWVELELGSSHRRKGPRRRARRREAAGRKEGRKRLARQKPGEGGSGGGPSTLGYKSCTGPIVLSVRARS